MLLIERNQALAIFGGLIAALSGSFAAVVSGYRRRKLEGR